MTMKRILKSEQVIKDFAYFKQQLDQLNITIELIENDSAKKNSLNHLLVDACYRRCYSMCDAMQKIMESDCAYKDQE